MLCYPNYLSWAYKFHASFSTKKYTKTFRRWPRQFKGWSHRVVGLLIAGWASWRLLLPVKSSHTDWSGPLLELWNTLLHYHPKEDCYSANEISDTAPILYMVEYSTIQFQFSICLHYRDKTAARLVMTSQRNIHRAKVFYWGIWIEKLSCGK